MEILSYYEDPGVREICHAIKEGDKGERKAYIDTIAGHFSNSNLIQKGDFLIPAPQHHGQAEYTLELSNLVAIKTGAIIADILTCQPHEPLYNLKQKGLSHILQFQLKDNIPEGNCFLVDNVIATGQTYFQIQNFLQIPLCPLVYAIDYSTFTDFDKIENYLPENIAMEWKNGKHHFKRKIKILK